MTLLGSELLALPVCVGDIVVGHAVDLLADRRLTRALGLEVRCGDDEHRFLPLAAAIFEPGAISVRSPLALLDREQLDVYASRATSLRSLRGTAVTRRGDLAGELADLELSSDGRVDRVLVNAGDGIRRVPVAAVQLRDHP